MKKNPLKKDFFLFLLIHWNFFLKIAIRLLQQIKKTKKYTLCSIAKYYSTCASFLNVNFINCNLLFLLLFFKYFLSFFGQANKDSITFKSQDSNKNALYHLHTLIITFKNVS